MRAYLSILIDSFREAVHSWVLWVVLACITLVFVLLFPIYLQEQATTGFRGEDLVNPVALAEKLIAAGEDKDAKPSPARHVWEHLDDDARKRLPDLLSRKGDSVGFESLLALGKLMESLQKQVSDPNWYDVEAFKAVKLRREGRELLSRVEKGEQVSDTEKKRLNRLLLEGAFPESIAFSPATSAAVGYLVFGPLQLPTTREQLKETLPPWVLRIVDYTFGIFGILAALLITAPVIPQMLEPGSLHLLLSKPVSRSLLLLTKFLGGCAFALITAAYFAVLLWLFLGLRLSIWDTRVLAAIPVYTFVFAVYYSVTALAGLLFRNTIISVVIGLMFWAFCFGLGFFQQVMEIIVVHPQRIQRVVVAGDSVLAVFPSDPGSFGGVFVLREFDPAESKWNTVYRSQEEGAEPFNQSYPEFGPFYDRESDQLVSVQRSLLRGPEGNVSVAPRSKSWPRTRGAALPSTTVSVAFDSDSRVVVVGLDGVYRSTKNVALAEEPRKVLGVSIPWGTASGFEKVSTGDWPFAAQPISVAIDETSDALAIYSRGQVAVWQRGSDDKYSQLASRALENEENTEMLAAMAGGRVLLAAPDGRLLLLDAQSLATRTESQPEGKNAVRQLRASPDGKHIAVLYTHGVVWRIDTATDKSSNPRLPRQGNISAIAFEPGSALLFAHDANRVSRWNPATGESQFVCRPALTTAEMAYYYGVLPVYTVLPKPGELYRTLLYLLTGKKATVSDDDQRLPADFQFVRKEDPWQPVWSGALFMAVMLAIGCLYMERMEF